MMIRHCFSVLVDIDKRFVSQNINYRKPFDIRKALFQELIFHMITVRGDFIKIKV